MRAPEDCPAGSGEVADATHVDVGVRAPLGVHPHATGGGLWAGVLVALEAPKAVEEGSAIGTLRGRERGTALPCASPVFALQLEALPAPLRERVQPVEEGLDPDSRAAKLPREPVERHLKARPAGADVLGRWRAEG